MSLSPHHVSSSGPTLNSCCACTEYLRIFTKAYHQVWTEILSQGGFAEPNFEAKTNYRPNDGSESVFVQGMKPKPRHFHSALFYNGSMYMFGGLDKDMYFNDM